MIATEQQNKIVSVLNERIKGLTCPMCHNNHFSMLEGYYHNVLQDDLDSILIDGRITPSIPIICNNCGFISQHALGPLGLLPKEEEKYEAIRQ